MLPERPMFDCPWCGERQVLDLAPDQPAGELVHDCRVCCRPVVVRVDTDGEGRRQIRPEREDG